MAVNCLITNISYFVYNRGKKFIQVWISVSILFEFSFLGELSLLGSIENLLMTIYLGCCHFKQTLVQGTKDL